MGTSSPDIQRTTPRSQDMRDKYLPVQVNDTQAVWFSMLETGLALIAVNLPSLWGLITQGSVRSTLRSLRSLLSINSHSPENASRQYVGLTEQSNPRKKPYPGSQSIELVPQKGRGEFETAITRDC